MSYILNAIAIILEHLYKNISNYLLTLGLAIVLFFIKVNFGLMPFILCVGILLILTAIIIELNRSIPKKKGRY